MAVKVYGPPYTSGNKRVFACFLEKIFDFEIVLVDMVAKEQKKPEFLALQPFGKVPVVQDRDLTLVKDYHKVLCREICRTGSLSAI
ncbi:hypothetical protein SUGI_1118430 [Cryptomeria japonica]|nr:hypothetical protein SUGI_1118430 [Cryptomeria japonica]